MKLLKDNLLSVFILMSFCLYAAFFIFKASIVVNGERYFILYDDMMISMRYAKNLVNGFGLVWNPGGERVEGFSNLLWVLYMALFHLLPVSLSKISLFIQVSGALFLLINLIIVKIIADHLFNRSKFVSILALFLTAFYFPLNKWSLLGMETSVLTFLVSLSVLLVLKNLGSKVPIGLYFVLGVAFLIRMDIGFVLWFAAFSFLMIADPKNRKGNMKWGLTIFLVFAAGLTLFRYFYFGEVLPNTYFLKLEGYPLLFRLTRGLYRSVLFVNGMTPLLFLTTFIILLARPSKKIIFLAALFLSIFLYNIYIGGDAYYMEGANRFMSPVMPLFFILLSGSIYLVGEMFKKFSLGVWIFNSRYNKLFIGLVVVVLFVGLNSQLKFRIMSQVFLLNVPETYQLEREQIYFAHELERVIKPDAKVAVTAAGVIPYFFEREYVDVLGKNDKVIARGKIHKLTGLRKYVKYLPGHMKWNYDYTIKKLKPDVWAYWWKDQSKYLAQEGVEYISAEIEHAPSSVYFLKNSPHIEWDKLKIAGI